jgi:hypothetical protein
VSGKKERKRERDRRQRRFEMKWVFNTMFDGWISMD